MNYEPKTTYQIFRIIPNPGAVGMPERTYVLVDEHVKKEDEQSAIRWINEEGLRFENYTILQVFTKP